MAEIICCVCGKMFERTQGEINRSKKLGRRFYCSLECVGKDNNKHLAAGQPRNLIPDNRRDEFSPYRWHYRNAERHAHRSPKKQAKEFKLTLQVLKDQFEKQGGVCPYTGWVLDNPATVREAQHTRSHPKRASLDRKDSTKGYTANNIQFVSWMANCAKNCFSEGELIEFCKAVANNR